MEAAYQKELLNAGILAQEAERKRMAIELHDSIGGLLSAAKIYVSNVSQELVESQFLLFKEKALQALTENIQEIRTITNDLLPQSLERLGIVSATRGLLEKLEELKQIKIDLQANAEQRFEGDREKALFRVLQELVHNTLKYSEAKNVAIHFQFSDTQLLVQYHDDGQGFDRVAYSQKQDKSYGLKNIERHMAFLNGELNYTTSPGNGVAVSLNLPLNTIRETHENTY
ncbi:sensor histidine kinase [Haliscomenobacter sp.]|uniref:sensor histidine kinase n=1 Tax=Haliscomenobacter sp. TaxID=2717303 RepID=UPI003BAB3120